MLLNGVTIDASGLFVCRLRAWEDFYNFVRAALRVRRTDALSETAPETATAV